MVSSARKIVKHQEKDVGIAASSRRRSLRSDAKLAGPSPSNKSSSSSASVACWDDKNWRLLLTTANRVCVWENGFCATVFTSGSEGILAAKQSKDGTFWTLADSQKVVLHKVDEGQHQSYRLKGAQGNCRLLQYSHDSRSLFFTDNIHNSVQTYSLTEDRVNEAAKAHPSPITAFCVSSDSNLLLSCSADPPIIQLHNRQMNTTVDIKPKASSKPVICCAFHPTRKSIFVLAFADGVVAAYDSTRLIRGETARAAVRKGNVGSDRGEHIHSFAHLHDATITGNAGITGIEFIPGYRSRAVTVGEDGKLCIVDFEKKDVLGSWHVGAPASSLSLRAAVGKDAGKGAKEKGWMAAVGTIHGRCFVFDGDGTKVCEETVDPEAGRVLDVEWVLGEVTLPPDIGGEGNKSASSRPAARARSTTQYPATMSSGTNYSTKETVTVKALSSLEGSSDPGYTPAHLPANTPVLPDIPKDPYWEDVVETSTAGYMKLFSPVKKKKQTKAMLQPKQITENVDEVKKSKERAAKPEDQRSAISAPLLWGEKPSAMGQGPAEANSVGIGMFDGSGSRGVGGATSSKLTARDSADTVNDSNKKALSPPNTLGEGKGSTVLAKSVSSSVTGVANATDHAKLLSNIRAIRGDSKGGVPTGLALFAPYMPPRPTAQGGQLLGFGSRAKVTNAGNESTLTRDLDGLSENVGSTSILDESTWKDESTVKDDDSLLVDEEELNNEKAKGDEAEERKDHIKHVPEIPIEESSDEADIWLSQGMEAGEIKFTKPKTNAANTKSVKSNPNAKKMGDTLKRKVPIDDGYEADVNRKTFGQIANSAAKNSGNQRMGTSASKTSAGVGSVRSPTGSNKSRKVHSEGVGRGYEDTSRISSRVNISGSASNVVREVSSGTVLRTVPTKPPSIASTASPSLRTIRPSDASRQPNTASWEDSLGKLREELGGGIKAMHQDMIRLFTEQKKMFDGFSKEIVSVRAENERLRKELIKLMGGRSRNMSGNFDASK